MTLSNQSDIEPHGEGVTQSGVEPVESSLLADGLRVLFGDLDAIALATIREKVRRVEVTAGEIVVREGESGSEVFCILSGRLRAHTGAGASRRFLNDMRPGETLGEVSFLNGTARTATVTAVRDSVLARLNPDDLHDILTRFPQVTLNMARLIARRLSMANSRRLAPRRPGNICLLPLTPLRPGWAPRFLAAKLVSALRGDETALLLSSESLGERLGDASAAQIDKGNPQAFAWLTRKLDALEAAHALVIYVPDDNLDSAWSQRCLRMADRILLLADATADPQPGPEELRHLNSTQTTLQAEQILVLLHDANVAVPSGTSRWLLPRALNGHLHIRPDLATDLSRLVRSLTGSALGLVFGSGGARCLSQLGAIKALHQADIPVDLCGGSGFGAVMAMLAGMHKSPDELIDHAREAFRLNPTGDISLLPMISLVKGQRLEEVFDQLVESLIGKDADIADSWATLFFTAANTSRAELVTLQHGPMVRSLRAASAIPGLLPPVPIGGHLMVDGGVFNTFPTDVMLRLGAGRIVGIGVERDTVQPFPEEDVPGSFALLSDALAGRRRKYRIPSLFQSVINGTTLYSASREAANRELADLYIPLHVGHVGMLDWLKFDQAVAAGFKQTEKILQGLSDEQVMSLRA